MPRLAQAQGAGALSHPLVPGSRSNARRSSGCFGSVHCPFPPPPCVRGTVSSRVSSRRRFDHCIASSSVKELPTPSHHVGPRFPSSFPSEQGSSHASRFDSSRGLRCGSSHRHHARPDVSTAHRDLSVPHVLGAPEGTDVVSLSSPLLVCSTYVPYVPYVPSYARPLFDSRWVFPALL